MSLHKVVLTGATGHLGSYAAQLLAQRGLEVVAASRTGGLPPVPFEQARSGNVRPLALDIERDDAVESLRAELGSGVGLVHLAAWHPPATATTTPEDRRRLLSCNVFGTMRVLEAARLATVESVVYASSFEVYGVPEQSGPVTESARLNPISDYGATKLSGEDHLLAFAYEQKTRVVALRLPAVYGPGEKTSRALPNFLIQVARGERPSIFGSGEDLRDQLHARDAAFALERALLAEASGIYNVADGAPHSILELARTALEVAGIAGEPRSEPSQKPRYDFHMDIGKARAELGFEPTVRLATGMREQLAWLRAGQRS